MTKAAGFAAIGLLTMLCACTGPRPEIVSYILSTPQSPEAPYIVRAKIRNTGGGEGQVQAIARIRSIKTRQTVAEAAQQIYFSPHENVQVTFFLHAPRADDYEVTVNADYPP